MEAQVTDHKIGTREEWLAAREQLLAREKEHTRLGDELARQRRELPWVRVEKDYRFDTDDGEKALGELFDGRSQLLVYHFMFGPSYEAGDPVNSSMADTVDGVLPHLHARDVIVRLRLASAAGEAAGLQASHGLELSLGLDRAHRLQLRPRLLVHRGTGREAVAEMRPTGLAPWTGLPPIVEQNASSTGTDVVGYLTESPGFSTFVRRRRRRVPHVLDDVARIGVPDGLLPDPRPRTEGPRRGRGVAALAPPARRVRHRVTRGSA